MLYPGYESRVSVFDQNSLFWDEIFSVIAQASIGNFGRRIVVPSDADSTNMVVKFALSINILLDDLEGNQERRIKELVEEALVQVVESKGIAEEVRVLLSSYLDKDE